MASPDTSFNYKPGDFIIDEVQPDGTFARRPIRKTASRSPGWDSQGRPGAVATGVGGSGDLSDDPPQGLGTAAAGTAEEASRADHVHASPFSKQSVTNNSGNDSVSMATGKRRHRVLATFGGSAGTRVIILPTTNREDGDVVEVVTFFPDTPDIIVEIRNATAGGTLLASFTTADFAMRGRFEGEFNGTAWFATFASFPV
jgi:hypothetical protein